MIAERGIGGCLEDAVCKGGGNGNAHAQCIALPDLDVACE